jgi:hypothetical protein
LTLNPAWLVIGLAALACAVATALWSRSSGRPSDIGFVSHQWLAEHRLSQPQDSER